MNHRLLAVTLACLCLMGPLTAQAQLRAGGSQPPAPALPSVGTTGTQQADYIVALVNSEPITNHEVRSEAVRVAQQVAQQRGTQPDMAEVYRQVLDRMISDKAQLIWAKEGGMKVEDTAVDAAEENVARQNQITVTELRRRLRGDGLTPAQFRSTLRDQILLVRVRDQEVGKRVRVSEFEIDQYLRDKANSTDPGAQETNIAQILVAVPDSATPQQVAALKDKAAKVQQRAQAGEDFAKLARELSDSPDRASGGEFGLRTLDRYPQLFADATQRLPVGGVSEVVRSGAGFHVLKVVERRMAGMPPAATTQNRASHILLRPTPQLDEAAARAKLLDIKKRVEDGKADFAVEAKAISVDGSAAQGGDLGWAGPGLFVPEFEDVLNRLQPGQISEPFVSRFGMHIIKLNERKQVPLTEKDRREFVREILKDKKTDEAYAIWSRDIRGRAFVEMREPPQ
jgi:peptidyl-prolyl cis-trans isomerase SurA